MIRRYFLYLKLCSGLLSMEWKPKFTPWLTRPCVHPLPLSPVTLSLLSLSILAALPTLQHAQHPLWALVFVPQSRIQFLTIFTWPLLPLLYVFAQMSLSVRPSPITLLKIPISFPSHHSSPPYVFFRFSIVFTPFMFYLFVYCLSSCSRT